MVNCRGANGELLANSDTDGGLLENREREIAGEPARVPMDNCWRTSGSMEEVLDN